MKQRTHGDFQPRIVDVRKPLRPVSVAATRRPIKVTKPISSGVATVPAARAR